MTIHVDDGCVESVEVTKVLVPDDNPRLVGDSLHDFDEGVEIWNLFVVDRLDDPTVVGIVKAERASGFANVDSLDSNRVESGLMVGDIVEAGAGNRNEAIRSNLVKVADLNLHLDILAAALQLQLDRLAHARVKNVVEPEELGDELAIGFDENIAFFDLCVGRTIRKHNFGY